MDFRYKLKMNDDLIRRNEVEAIVKKGCGFMSRCNVCKKEVKEIPNVDAVEVVRCKECMYWKLEDELPHITAFMECVHSGPYKGNYTDKDFYCAYGERKGN